MADHQNIVDVDEEIFIVGLSSSTKGLSNMSGSALEGLNIRLQVIKAENIACHAAPDDLNP